MGTVRMSLTLSKYNLLIFVCFLAVGAILACCAACCVGCIENLVEYFNR